MKKKEIIFLALIIVVQTFIFVVVGINKQYIHMDEAYSLGLASYDRVEIQSQEDFYNTWHTNEYFEDYLSVQDDEVGKYSQVYENQKNDVHPPFYYLFLRIAMGFSRGHYSKWPGIILNIIVYAFITIFMYLILKNILSKEKYRAKKSAILAFVSSITLASLTSVIYIRMYALSTLNILITTYLHIRLYKSEKTSWKLLVCIGLSALIGSLTHYYYLFFLAMMYLIFAIKYLKKKDLKSFGFYTFTMGVAAVLSLLIFPYSIQHMFFGYRGQGVLSKLANFPEFINSIRAYFDKINVFGFNNLLKVILTVMIVLIIYNLIKKRKFFDREITKWLKLLVLPSLFYFLLVAVASPWVELRYIMPICGLVFISVILMLYMLLKKGFDEKLSNIIISVILLVILIAPCVFKIEPEVAFSDKKEIVQALEGELNLPTLYIFNTQCNRFLDDILLFSKINESYIAKDIECTEENVSVIFDGKDISKGVVIFINEDQDNDEILDTVKMVTGLNECEHLKRLNACDVYYIK